MYSIPVWRGPPGQLDPEDRVRVDAAIETAETINARIGEATEAAEIATEAAEQTDADAQATEAGRQQAVQAAGDAAAARQAAEAARLLAEQERQAAEAAAVAAALRAGYYDTIAAGRAAVADGESFAVRAGGQDGLARPTIYRRDSATTQTAMVPIVSAGELGAYQTIGNAITSQGTSVVADRKYAYQAPLVAGKITRIRMIAATAGSVTLTQESIPGGIVVGQAATQVWGPLTLPVVAGMNDITLATPIEAVPGAYLAVRANGRLSYQASELAAVDSFAISTISSTIAFVYTDVRLDLQYDLEPDFPAASSLAATVKRNDAALTTLTPAVAVATERASAASARMETLGGQSQILGAPSPAQGDTTALASSQITYAWAEPVARRSRVKRLRGYAYQSPISVAVYTVAGGAFTRQVVHSISVAPQAWFDLDAAAIRAAVGADIVAEPGQLVGVYCRTYRTPVGADIPATPYYSLSGASGTLPSLVTSLRVEVQTEMESLVSDTDPVVQRAVALATQVTPGYQPTVGYILVWGIGQSNLAGRATSASAYVIEAGRSYKWSPADAALVTLVEPTGTDATALTGRTGIGSAMAKSVLDATGGRIGVIFVNSAVGGTRIDTNWASGGSSWTAAQAMWDAALSDIAAKRLNIVGSAVAFIQGESNGDVGTSGADYKSAFADLRSRILAKMGSPRIPIIMSQIGVDRDATDPLPYAVIRQAQAEIVRDTDGVFMAASSAKFFKDRSLMMDQFHYTSLAYDELGNAMGEGVLARGMGMRPAGLAE
jgi:hypothetical protein